MRASGLANVVVLSLLLCLTSPARADWDSSGSGGDCGTGCAVATGVLIGIVDVVFLSADIGYGARGRWLPAGWAWGQTIWGAGNLFAGVVLTPLGALVESKNMFGLGIGFGVLGTWFMVHGIISLVKHYRGPRGPRRYGLAGGDGPRRLHLPEVSFGPTVGGGHGVLRWTF